MTELGSVSSLGTTLIVFCNILVAWDTSKVLSYSRSGGVLQKTARFFWFLSALSTGYFFASALN